MMYAINAAGQRTQAAKGQHASCPGCKGPVIARCGQIKVHHWAHETGCECDPWHEPETPWHINWKMQFQEQRREVVVPPHRADVIGTWVDTDNEARCVVELQHSAIDPAEIEEREIFYLREINHMVWVIDARDFAHHFEFVGQDTFNGGATVRASFKWKHFRRSWGSFHLTPRYLDFGNELWRIDDVNDSGLGSCRSYSYHEFLSEFEEALGYNLPVKWRPTSTGGWLYRFGKGNVLLFKNRLGRYQFRTTWDGSDFKVSARSYSNTDEAKRACEPHLNMLMRTAGRADLRVSR
jgi:hypothetical protein